MDIIANTSASQSFEKKNRLRSTMEEKEDDFQSTQGLEAVCCGTESFLLSLVDYSLSFLKMTQVLC